MQASLVCETAVLVPTWWCERKLEPCLLTTGQAHPSHQARALYDYTRQTDEEVSFTEDAVLEVFDTSDPDWILVGLDSEYGFGRCLGSPAFPACGC